MAKGRGNKGKNRRRGRLATPPKVVAPDNRANEALDELRPKLTRVFSEYIVIGYLKGTNEPFWYIQGHGVISGGALAKWATEEIRDRILASIPPELPELEEGSESSTSLEPSTTYYRPVAERGVPRVLQDYMVYLRRENAERDYPGAEVVEVSSHDVPNPVIMDEESQ